MKTRVILEKIHVSKDRNGDVNGSVISLWKDWEGHFQAPPKQVYMNVCLPGAVKGPHLHMHRWDYFVCIKGRIRFIVKWDDCYEEVEAEPERDGVFKIVEVPPAIPSAIQNIGNTEAWFLNMPNPAWHPDNPDDHPVTFDGYEWRR